MKDKTFLYDIFSGGTWGGTWVDRPTSRVPGVSLHPEAGRLSDEDDPFYTHGEGVGSFHVSSTTDDVGIRSPRGTTRWGSSPRNRLDLED